MKKFWFSLLGVVGLIGCSSTSPVQNSVDTTLNQAELCCESLVAAPWVPLELNDSLEFAINQSSPVWRFESNKSYFSGLKFNERSGMVDITIRSVMAQGRVLKPTIALLDSSYAVVDTIASNEFEVKFSDAFAKNRYEKQLTVDAKKTPYFIVYADTTNLGAKVVVPHPAKLRAEKTGDPLPIVTDPSYYVSTNGFIDIEVETTSVSGGISKGTKYAERSIQEKLQIQPETQSYYHASIEKAVKAGDIPKALSLLDEAKALGVEGAQEVFVKAVNAK